MKAHIMVAFTEGNDIFILEENELEAIHDILNTYADYPKIYAIKWLRNKKGYTLRDAKLIVETFITEQQRMYLNGKKGVAA